MSPLNWDAVLQTSSAQSLFVTSVENMKLLASMILARRAELVKINNHSTKCK